MSTSDRSERGGGHGRGGHNAAKRGSWSKLEQTFLQRTAGSGSLEENMRETLMENNILPAPQRKVRRHTQRLPPVAHTTPSPA